MTEATTEEKTLQELQQEHQASVSRTLIRRADLLEMTRKDPNISTPREQADREREIVREARERVYGEMDRYEQAYRDRKSRVEAHLYGLHSPDDAALLGRVVGATPEDLAALLDAAIRTNNQEMGRAVFAEADRRGLASLTHRYFDELAPDAYELYLELVHAPTEDDLQRERDNLPEVTRGPDSGYGRAVRSFVPPDRGFSPGPYQPEHYEIHH